jgi:hypothetical protein
MKAKSMRTGLKYMGRLVGFNPPKNHTRMKRHIAGVFIVMGIIASLEGFSQDIGWRTNISSFFDNSEFAHSNVSIPQTMGGVHLAPELVFQYDSLHSIVAGVDLLHEFGSDGFIDKLTPTAYYQFKKGEFSFVMGAFQRRMVAKNYPRFFFRDSIGYYMPNMNGLALIYNGKALKGNLWLDWASRQSYTKRETFFVGFSGEYKRGTIFAKNFSYMYHFAGVMEPIHFEPLHDNLLSLTTVGVDLSGLTFIDRLSVSAGWAVGLDRARTGSSDWLAHNGIYCEIEAGYKWVGVFNSLYIGSPQMYYYGIYNNELYWGDPFYRAGNYNRTDLYINFLDKDFVAIKLLYSLHVSEGELYQQQVLKLSFDIGDSRKNN